MANVDNPTGLTPVEHFNGSPWNGATRRCRVDATAGALYVGDPVVWNGSGYVGYPEVVKATAGDGNKIFGVIASIEADPTNLERTYIASADSGWVRVCVDPTVVYEIQGCSGSALNSNSIGLNAVLIYTHSGDTTTGLSGAEMDSGASTAPSANASYQLLILGLVDREDNEMDAKHAKWLVMINLHSLTAADASAGGAAEGAKGV